MASALDPSPAQAAQTAQAVDGAFQWPNIPLELLVAHARRQEEYLPSDKLLAAAAFPSPARARAALPPEGHAALTDPRVPPLTRAAYISDVGRGITAGLRDMFGQLGFKCDPLGQLMLLEAAALLSPRANAPPLDPAAELEAFAGAARAVAVKFGERARMARDALLQSPCAHLLAVLSEPDMGLVLAPQTPLDEAALELLERDLFVSVERVGDDLWLRCTAAATAATAQTDDDDDEPQLPLPVTEFRRVPSCGLFDAGVELLADCAEWDVRLCRLVRLLTDDSVAELEPVLPLLDGDARSALRCVCRRWNATGQPRDPAAIIRRAPKRDRILVAGFPLLGTPELRARVLLFDRDKLYPWECDLPAGFLAAVSHAASPELRQSVAATLEAMDPPRRVGGRVQTFLRVKGLASALNVALSDNFEVAPAAGDASTLTHAQDRLALDVGTGWVQQKARGMSQSKREAVIAALRAGEPWAARVRPGPPVTKLPDYVSDARQARSLEEWTFPTLMAGRFRPALVQRAQQLVGLRLAQGSVTRLADLEPIPSTLRHHPAPAHDGGLGWRLLLRPTMLVLDFLRAKTVGSFRAVCRGFQTARAKEEAEHERMLFEAAEGFAAQALGAGKIAHNVRVELARVVADSGRDLPMPAIGDGDALWRLRCADAITQVGARHFPRLAAALLDLDVDDSVLDLTVAATYPALLDPNYDEFDVRFDAVKHPDVFETDEGGVVIRSRTCWARVGELERVRADLRGALEHGEPLPLHLMRREPRRFTSFSLLDRWRFLLLSVGDSTVNTRSRLRLLESLAHVDTVPTAAAIRLATVAWECKAAWEFNVADALILGGMPPGYEVLARHCAEALRRAAHEAPRVEGQCKLLLVRGVDVVGDETNGPCQNWHRCGDAAVLRRRAQILLGERAPVVVRKQPSAKAHDSVPVEARPRWDGRLPLEQLSARELLTAAESSPGLDLDLDLARDVLPCYGACPYEGEVAWLADPDVVEWASPDGDFVDPPADDDRVIALLCGKRLRKTLWFRVETGQLPREELEGLVGAPSSSSAPAVAAPAFSFTAAAPAPAPAFAFGSSAAPAFAFGDGDGDGDGAAPGFTFGRNQSS